MDIRRKDYDDINRIWCSCVGECGHLCFYKDEDGMDICFCEYWIKTQSFIQRLKSAWKVLRGRSTGEICLTTDQVEQFIKKLQEMIKK